MERTNRMSSLVTLTAQRLVQFVLVATIAFILGLAAAPAIPSFFTRATTSPRAAAPRISRQVLPQHAAVTTSRHTSTGSVYDGQPLKGIAASRTTRSTGTNTVYDGQPLAAAPRRAMPAEHAGTGSAYDGQPLQQRAVPVRSVRQSGTGTVYDGQPLQQTHAAARMVRPVRTGSVYDGQPTR